MISKPPEPPIVRFGEQHSRSSFQYLQVERVSTRIRKYNWELFPHRHADLLQIALVEAGEGEVQLDLEKRAFAARSVVVVPPRMVHSFRLAPDARVFMLTAAESYLDEAVAGHAARGLFEIVRGPHVLELAGDAEAWRSIQSSFQNLRAYQDQKNSRARTAVLTANLLAVVSILGEQAGRVPTTVANIPQHRLYDRFRDLLEISFRNAKCVADYASALNVTERTLHRACTSVAGESPLKLIHQRIVLEAQRQLLYSHNTIAEIAYSLGFEEPSNFSRLFADNMGESPLSFRRSRIG
ncbi:helix-turn-helix transcriptional regulator [Mesorhizobium sp. KR2-14]|uniref:AraC family transcriptional regulator n=1 Tax=Mesorhizobium sp. KR2-14 TaxID=3156610 RepID=UPI0032B321D2